jgi:agmatinase
MSVTFRTRHSHCAGLWPEQPRSRHHHPDFDKMATQGWQALEAEGKLPSGGWRKERLFHHQGQ